jgi:hypothetical protein
MGRNIAKQPKAGAHRFPKEKIKGIMKILKKMLVF